MQPCLDNSRTYQGFLMAITYQKRAWKAYPVNPLVAPWVCSSLISAHARLFWLTSNCQVPGLFDRL